MIQEENKDSHLADISTKATAEAGLQDDGIADATNDAEPATEESPQSEIEFFRKLFFLK